jgi:hypothetical protein
MEDIKDEREIVYKGSYMGVPFECETAGEVIQLFKKDYSASGADASEGETFESIIDRLDLATHQLNVLQKSIIKDSLKKGLYKELPADKDDIIRAVLCLDKKCLPNLEFCNNKWSYPVPLALNTMMFKPYNELKKPTGNIIWIDPTDELSYIQSLAKAGIIELERV